MSATMTLPAPVVAPPPKPSDVPTEPVYRFSVAQYHRMIELDILNSDDGVELLYGWLVPKMPKNPPHTTATGLTRDQLARMISPGYFLNVQEPITLAASEPEPDICIVRGDRRLFTRRHPGPADLILIVEVADTTLDRDRGFKFWNYAEAGIPVYWIVNLIDRRIEVYTLPSGPTAQPTYGKGESYGPGEDVPVVIDGQEVGRIPVSELLP